MYKSIIYLTTILISLATNGFCQSFLIIEGKIIDEYSGNNVAFATISDDVNKKGTISNLQGEFTFKLPASYDKKIIISHLNYFSKTFIVDSLLNKQLTIRLKPRDFTLNNIDVWPSDPIYILNKAIENIQLNYRVDASNLTGFYREVIKENQNKIQHLEAVIEIYKASLNTKSKDRLKITKGAVYNDIHQSIIWNYIKFINSPYELIKSDIAKHPKDFISVAQSRDNFLNPKYYNKYNYTIINQRISDNSNQFIIEFKPNKKSKKTVFEGVIYIDKKNYAILGIEYYFSLDRLNSARLIDDFTQKQLIEKGIYIKAIDFFSIVNYKYFNGKLIINNSNMGYNFVLVDKYRKKPSVISANFDLVINDIDTVNVTNFKPKNWIKYEKSLTEQIDSKSDSMFWENYNIIPLEK